MHPAHIGLKIQPLEKYEIGKTYELHLHELEGTPMDHRKIPGRLRPKSTWSPISKSKTKSDSQCRRR